MIGTTGRFQINPRWAFGWNGMLQSDANFSRTYEIDGFDAATFRK
ncbi:MAG: LPS assembly protein LptD [Ahrensia sp.]|nr:LPS assembly protein LptD [Ahrensia sp.]